MKEWFTVGADNGEIKKQTALLFAQHRIADESTKIELENEIIQLNFNLALHKTWRYRHTTLDEEDIAAVAIAGLFLAVRSYDYTKAAFATFAGKVIENEINGLFRKQLRQKRSAITPMSLNQVMNDSERADTYLDRVVDETVQIEQKLANKQVFQELCNVCSLILNDLELAVLKNSLLPTGERKSQTELGISLSRAQSTINRTEKRAIKKLRDYIVEQGWGLELLRG